MAKIVKMDEKFAAALDGDDGLIASIDELIRSYFDVPLGRVRLPRLSFLAGYRPLDIRPKDGVQRGTRPIRGTFRASLWAAPREWFDGSFEATMERSQLAYGASEKIVFRDFRVLEDDLMRVVDVQVTELEGLEAKRTSASPSCPRCGAAMREIPAKPGAYKAFLGCTMYRKTGCKGTRPAI